ncbi:MAG TPA: hypothetical protein VLQ80_08180 [Candidatus Saccharimonadia bacterium]|nr:hypothetical protein [Candidatus Saccharimonadia bacterium]
MNFFIAIVLFMIIVGALAVVWWGFNRIALPEPFKTILLVIIALVALAFLYNFVASGGHVHLPN